METKSLRKPLAADPKESDEIKRYDAAIYMIWKPPGISPAAWSEIVFSVWMMHYFVYGLKGAALHLAVTNYLIDLAHVMTLKMYFTLSALSVVLLIGVLWIVNPELKKLYEEEYSRGRYVMGYNERLWWAEAFKVGTAGPVVYKRMEEIGDVLAACERGGGMRVIRGTPWVTDKLWFLYIWQEERGHPLFMYTRIDWAAANANFVGLLHNIGLNEYILRDGFTDIWLP